MSRHPKSLPLRINPRTAPCLIIAALWLFTASTLTGCATPARPVLTEAQLQERAVKDQAEMAATIHDAITRLMARIERRAEESPGEVLAINILAMSGGGDYGAFGAGVLVGWGATPDPRHRRPDFDIVTGVSTGALLAPFAYIGTDEACLKVESLYRNPKQDWVKESGLLFFLPSNPSFMKIPGLERDLRAVVDAEMIAQMAEQSRAGKLLAISSTDLDLGRQRFWEVGTESEKAVQNGNFDRVQRMMLASAAIPAVFPPIQIGDSLYGDGGVTANVFFRLEVHNPSALFPRWRAAHPDKPLPKVRYWVIINNQASHVPKTVQAKWPEVIGPSLAAAIRSATWAEVRWLAAQADYVNAKYGTDIEVRVLMIPDDWRPPVKGDFKKPTMESLTDLGRKLGSDPNSWTIWTTPESSAERRVPSAASN
jgi:hypothetical protein